MGSFGSQIRNLHEKLHILICSNHIFIIFLKNRPKIRFLWKYVEPPNAIFKKLDFEIYNLNNRWYSQHRLEKSVCPIDFLNLRSTAKCPHQQKERFFSAAANPWDFWSPAGYPWISIDIHWYPWISIDIDGYQWISMDINGYPWISMDIKLS